MSIFLLGSILCWTYFSVVFFGLGCLLRRCFKFDGSAGSALDCIWLGWAFQILLLQLWHLFHPIDNYVFVLFSLTGICGLCIHLSATGLNVFFRSIDRKTIAALVFIAAFIANRSSGPIVHYDAGLYYLTAIHTAQSHPILPGLANLHCRLGFNNASFLYTALIDIAPWPGHGLQLSNGLLTMYLAASMLEAWFAAQKNDLSPRNCFLALLSAPVLYLISFGPNLSSASPDLPVFVLGIVISARLLQLFETEQDPCAVQYTQFFILLMSACGIAMKLSFAAFAFASVFAVILNAITRKNSFQKLISWLVPCTLVAVWIIRTVVLSGYPLYPSAIAGAPVDWAVPEQTVLATQNLIRAFAREPGAEPAAVLSGWAWLKPWSARLVRDEKVKIIFPAILFLASMCVIVAARLFSAARRTEKVQASPWFLAPAFAAAIFWFIAAPEPRLAGSFFLILGFGSAVLAAQAIASSTRTFLSFGSMAAIQFIFCAGFGLLLYHHGTSLLISSQDTGTIPEIRTKELETASGLKIRVPESGDQCWNTPFPCTPDFNRALSLRRADTLSAGFRVSK